MDISPVFNDEKASIKRENPIFFYRYFQDPILMLREGDWCLLGYEELIPRDERLNVGALAKIGPWHFEANHMEYLKGLMPKYFELYYLSNDKQQVDDLHIRLDELREKYGETPEDSFRMLPLN